jgi:hypothetical protein
MTAYPELPHGFPVFPSKHKVLILKQAATASLQMGNSDYISSPFNANMTASPSITLIQHNWQVYGVEMSVRVN